MNYQIESWPAFKVLGVSHKLKTSEAFGLVPGIWKNAWEDGIMKKFEIK